ncbi:putative Ig domain-containing protein [Methanomethylovorans sp.]|uniref:putative Ig domain-containing protein n=1 Tax=Methanomethylovorans sp. TaxID=2758717 RepID=UPI00345E84A3
MKLYVDGTLFDEKISDSNGFASFYYYNINGTEWNTNHTFYIEYNTSEITTSQEPNEIYFNSFSIIPSSNHVGPREYFTIDINIDPVVPVNSARFNVRYDSARTSASDVAPGGLFRGNGVLFDTGVIDNNAGMITGIYGNRYIAPIYGPGTAVIVTMQAGNDTGVLDIALDDIGIVNESAVPLPYTAHAASVLVDTPPEIGPMGPMSVVELEELAFDIPAYDADGDTLIYSSAALPSGASLDSQTGAFTWTPLRGQAGSYTIDFSVSDGHLNDSCSMDIEVLPANDPPVITSFEPQNGTEHMEGRPIEISVQAVDADDDQLTYSIMIDGVSMSDTPSYTWVTDYSSAGEHVIEVAVSDGTHTVTAMRTITVLDVRPRMEIPALPRDGSGTGTSHAF